MLSRHFEILISTTLPELPQDTLLIGGSGFPFSQTANLLGQEFKNIVIDARFGIHLETLAIAAGTLQSGGLLLLVLSGWENLSQLPDTDSLRWSGESQPIPTPNFVAHFKHCVAQFSIKVLREKDVVIFAESEVQPAAFFEPTYEQSEILHAILAQKYTHYFLTAKRGRGKSALLGMLAEHLVKKNQPVYLCAPNQSAVRSVKKFCSENLPFIAPDELVRKLEEAPDFASNAWLLVDEAAMIPLSLLQVFHQHFDSVVFCSTTQSYEGTGRGFELKFKNFCKNYRAFTLHQPLRWHADDRLEPFIEQLLLLNTDETFTQAQVEEILSLSLIEIQSLSQKTLAQTPQDFYGLLCAAHYRTSPLDLRRLLDAPKQHFWQAQYQQNLLGALWAVEEGDIHDDALIIALQRGERRPRGNLAVQTLTLHYQQPTACKLRSWRISRIAVAPNWQKKGIGKKLIATLKESAVDFGKDFLSVSFGYTPELARFWQTCGFTLVHFSQGKEASSGCFSVIALYGVSIQGREWVAGVAQEFQRNLPLNDHPLAQNLNKFSLENEQIWQLYEQDWLQLQGFAQYHVPYFTAHIALKRLAAKFPVLQSWQSANPIDFGGTRAWLEAYRDAVKSILNTLSNENKS